MSEELLDVSTESPSAASTEVAESSTAVVETSVESPASVTGTEAATSTEAETVEVDPLDGLPTTEELQQQAANKVQHAEALARLRPAYEGLKSQLDSYKTLDPWKEIAETIGDPLQAQSAYELVNAIHTPTQDNPNGFSTRPFLERLETESPGTVDQLFSDTLTFQVPDANGQPSTVVRELVKSWGLDPDRIDDYRNIDTLRTSGVVTAEDISKIPEKYHPAFKSLSPAAREDLLSLQETNPAAMEEYLRNANDALEARTWREKDEQAKKDAAEQQRIQFEQKIAADVEQDFSTEVKGLHDSIHQNLSQVKFSSDPTINDLESAKVMSTLATLQHPYYRFVAENALKAVGVTIDPKFDEWANRWAERREAYTKFMAYGDRLQASRALSEATHAKQQVLLRLNDYALKLAKPSLSRLASENDQLNSTLAATSARFVPSGNGAAQQGAVNPYANNPHPPGSQEWAAYYRQVDKELGVNGASLLGRN